MSRSFSEMSKPASNFLELTEADMQSPAAKFPRTTTTMPSATSSASRSLSSTSPFMFNPSSSSFQQQQPPPSFNFFDSVSAFETTPQEMEVSFEPGIMESRGMTFVEPVARMKDGTGATVTLSSTFDNASFTFNHSPANSLVLINERDLSEMKGCYGAPMTHRIARFQKQLFGQMRSLVEVTYSTHNDDQKLLVCAKSLFEERQGQQPYHWAYLFTTNDPINCDNFNKYSKTGKCVEQSAFCEGKVKVALNKLRMLDDDTMINAVWNNLMDPKLNKFVNTQLLLGLLNDAGTNVEDTEYASIKDDKPQLLEAVKTKFASNKEDLATRYIVFLENCLKKPIGLPPASNYKAVGGSILNINGFIETWDQLNVACVATERNKMQRSLQNETELLVGMRARCIIECSVFDNLWGCTYGKGVEDIKKKKMAYFDTEDGRNEMMQMIEKVTPQQDTFIHSLQSLSSSDATPASVSQAVNLILNSALQHKLGLTIRLLQALYCRELELHKSIHAKIAEIMFQNGLEWNVVLPEGLQAHATGFPIFELAKMVGVESSS